MFGSPPRTWGILCETGWIFIGERFTPTHVGNTSVKSVRRDYAGSPPRTWGIRSRETARPEHAWFTPTHVGNTDADLQYPHCPAVHPHARGEYWWRVTGRLIIRGSPPRTWGIQLLMFPVRRLLRFTPTHVGNTSRPTRSWSAFTVHPHARGEYQLERWDVSDCGGSPPRTWGIRFPCRYRDCRTRFTPTHVGNTSLYCSQKCHRAVHPHARGEYPLSRSNFSQNAGSPPRTWGIRTRQHPPDPCAGSPPRTWGIHRRPAGPGAGVRFTPTHVGNTGCTAAPPTTPSVHPHARGEYYRSTRSPSTSSVHPHARGEYEHAHVVYSFIRRFTPTHVGNTKERGLRLKMARFTPTHVGNTRVRGPDAATKAVHPHARGEYALQQLAHGAVHGSPPRTWGIRLDCSSL